MKLRITIASSEVEDFAMEVLIDADSTFEDLHNIIQKGCKYMDFGVHRFYVCDEDWHPDYRVVQTDRGMSSDEDVYLMEDTPLGDLLEDEGQRIAYRFDPESKRVLLMEVTETSFGGKIDEPVIKRMFGKAPLQMLMDEEIAVPQPTTPSTNEDDEEDEDSFYGDDEYEEDELDVEGFDVIG